MSEDQHGERMTRKPIKRRTGCLYSINRDGYVMEQPLKGRTKMQVGTEKVVPEKGYLYYLDAKGYVRRIRDFGIESTQTMNVRDQTEPIRQRVRLFFEVVRDPSLPEGTVRLIPPGTSKWSFRQVVTEEELKRLIESCAMCGERIDKKPGRYMECATYDGYLCQRCSLGVI